MENKQYHYATGKRKTSIARVKLYTESGSIVVNGKPMEEIFGWETWREIVTEPLKLTDNDGKVSIVAKLSGGGVVSQAGALRHGIARALQIADPSLRATLKKAGFLTRDSREKERKKYGLVRARKAKQFSKR